LAISEYYEHDQDCFGQAELIDRDEATLFPVHLNDNVVMLWSWICNTDE
jgi:hypothetical protein